VRKCGSAEMGGIRFTYILYYGRAGARRSQDGYPSFTLRVPPPKIVGSGVVSSGFRKCVSAGMRKCGNAEVRKGKRIHASPEGFARHDGNYGSYGNYVLGGAKRWVRKVFCPYGKSGNGRKKERGGEYPISNTQ